MTFEILPHHSLKEELTFHRPEGTRWRPVSLEDAALTVMTDLKVASAVTIGPRESIEAAEKLMILRAVRLLLIVDLDDRILGLITATDVAGEKPLRFAQENKVKHKEILVGDLMTTAESIEVLHIQDVSHARVGDIVETLKLTHRQHALVVDHQGPMNERTLRGILSLSQIARQLGVQVRRYELAETLADIAHHTRS